MRFKFLAIIVVYKKNPIETEAFRSLIQCSRGECELRIVLWDNSPTIFDINKIESGVDIVNVHTPKNIGLSEIYNNVIVNHLKNQEYIIILDQDTVLPACYLERAMESFNMAPDVDLFLPLVEANKKIVSPVNYLCGWGWRWNVSKVGVLSTKRKLAINSGMIVSSKYLHGKFCGYDERLKFYGTDTQFMLDYADCNEKLFVLNVKLNHDLSFYSSKVIDKVIKFREMRNAYKIIYEKRPLRQFVFVNVVMFFISVLYAIRNRDFKFLIK